MPMLLCVAACSGGQQETPSPEPVALVRVAPTAMAAIADTVTLYGEVERGGASQIVLAAPVEAVVVEIVAPAGSAVSTGQLVVRLRASPVSQAEVTRTAADADAADRAYARARRLRADGLASDAEVETARAAAQGAAALSGSMRQRQAALLLRAPHAGYVSAIGASPGDIVQPGTAVATLSRSGDQRARFGVVPALAARIAPGASIMVEGGNGAAPFAARVESVSPVADAQTRLATLLVRIPSGTGLAPGVPLTAKLQAKAAATGISIPYAALLDDGGQPYVFVVAKGVAHRRDVVSGPVGGDRVAITSGLTAGDQVVVEGNAALDDGVKVRMK